MKAFRLARLLRLREETAKIKRLDWALSERSVASASERVHRAKDDLNASEAQLRGDLVGRRGTGSVGAILSVHDVLDSQRADIDVRTGRLEEARIVADEKRLKSQEAQRDVEALARLETRWRKEQKALSRRRAARAADEYIASKVSTDQARRRAADSALQRRTASPHGEDQ